VKGINKPDSQAQGQSGARSPERFVLSWRLRSPSTVSTHFGLCSRSKNEAQPCSTLRLGMGIVSAVKWGSAAQLDFTVW